MGTYLLKPVINRFILPGDMTGLVRGRRSGMGGLCTSAAHLATLGYNQLMIKSAQTVVQEIRRDLFVHVQKLPLKYFDAHTHGELMSRFTNDVDTVQEAMNNSFRDDHPELPDAGRNRGHDDGLKRAAVPDRALSFWLSCLPLSGLTGAGAANISSGSRRSWDASAALSRK